MDDISLAGKLVVMAVLIGFVVLMAYFPKIMAKIRGTKNPDND